MNWIDTIKAVAPTVATVLGGPLAGVAISALGSAMGIDSPTQEKIAKTLMAGQLTPEALAEIQKLELKYKDDDREREFKYADLTFKDTDSARKMQMETKSMVPAVLAGVVTVGFFGILIFLILNSTYKPTEPLLVLLGALSTSWTAIISFFFGSSHGSQSKNELLYNSTPIK